GTAAVAVIIVGVVALLAVVGIKQSQVAKIEASRAEKNAAESRQRLAQMNVANGIRLINEGQLFGSLPWFIEALKLEQGDARREEIHRLRLGFVLQQCPRLVQVCFHANAVTDAAFSPDGRHLATATGGKVRFMFRKKQQAEARVWDLETGQPVGVPMKHDGGIIRLAYSRDGGRLATASADNTARVWDGLTGEPITAPLQHSNSVVQVAFSPDGNRIATASH